MPQPFRLLIAVALLSTACGARTELESTERGGAGGTVPFGNFGGVSGGVATGGTCPIGSSGGVAGAASGGSTPECAGLDSAECKLYDDCCTCEARSANAPAPPACNVECEQTRCKALGDLAGVDCIAGHCVTGFDCFPAECGALLKCPAGMTQSRVAGCRGPCVPAEECRRVFSCQQCNGPNTCVQYQTGPWEQRSSEHCVRVPEGCECNTVCSCMGPQVCTGYYVDCTDLSGTQKFNSGAPSVACECPNC